jgi:endonuclease/exonuclease/phosphatase family metal-dependent hydrolase
MVNNNLKIITWNTFAIPILKKYNYKVQKIKEFIEKHSNDIDIICLNEVFDWRKGRYNCFNTSKLCGRLLSLCSGVVYSDGEIVDQKNDIIQHAQNYGFNYHAKSKFKSSSRFRILDGGLLILSKHELKDTEFIEYNTEPQPVNKGFIYTSFNFNNSRINLVSTHLTSHSEFYGSNTKIKLNELKYVKSYLDKKNITKYIVCGDMNMNSSYAYNNMLKILDVKDNKNNDITHITNNRYDYIFVSRNINTKTYRVFTDETTVASDHRPIYVELDMDPNK